MPQNEDKTGAPSRVRSPAFPSGAHSLFALLFLALIRGMALSFEMHGADVMGWRPTKNPKRADARAMRRDWLAVGRDIRKAAA